MRWWKRFAIAAFVAFLYYLCQIATNGLEAYKHSVYWEFQDIAAMLAGILLLAALAMAVDALVSWSASPLLRRLFNHIFLLALAGGVLAVVGRIFFPLYITQVFWMAAMVVLGLSFAQPQWKLDRFMAKICLYCSPAVFLVFVRLFFWGTWPDQLENHLPLEAGAARQVRKTPVFFFVFDEWSFPRSSEKGEFSPTLKNMRALAAQSVVFTEAVSPTVATFQSLPRYIFQNDLTYKDNGGNLGFQDGDNFVLSTQKPSLFLQARQQGYKTFLMGWYHAYRRMLGDQVDYFRVFQGNRPPRHSFYDTFLWRMERNGRFLNDPISLQIELDPNVGCRQWYEMDVVFREEMLELLARSTPNSFAFFHVPWPHAPFVCNPDGTYSGYLHDWWNYANTEGYLRHLQFVDQSIGEIVDTLRSADQFDDALLILTSDHGWRTDPDTKFNSVPNFNRRVPLILKLPGEKTSRRSEKEFCPNQLKPLIDAVISGEKDIPTLIKLLDK